MSPIKILEIDHWIIPLLLTLSVNKLNIQNKKHYTITRTLHFLFMFSNVKRNWTQMLHSVTALIFPSIHFYHHPLSLYYEQYLPKKRLDSASSTVEKAFTKKAPIELIRLHFSRHYMNFFLPILHFFLYLSKSNWIDFWFSAFCIAPLLVFLQKMFQIFWSYVNR